MCVLYTRSACTLAKKYIQRPEYILCHAPPISFRQGLSQSLGLAWQPANPSHLPVSVSYNAGLTGMYVAVPASKNADVGITGAWTASPTF